MRMIRRRPTNHQCSSSTLACSSYCADRMGDPSRRQAGWLRGAQIALPVIAAPYEYCGHLVPVNGREPRVEAEKRCQCRVCPDDDRVRRFEVRVCVPAGKTRQGVYVAPDPLWTVQ